MINYSIIIPHKNIPHLLQRCLDSIPRREDVQIIVVDDNSDPEIVDFANFPGLNESFVEVVFGKNENGRKGPGYARNTGLKRAKGNWIVFADADDFFNPCFEEALNKYKDDENDVVFFKSTSVDSKTLAPATRHSYRNNLLVEVQQTNDWNIAIPINEPWGKFIKKDLIEQHNLYFPEIQCSEDVLFSIKLAMIDAKKIVSDYALYCITDRQGSLIKDKTIKVKIVFFNVACQAVDYLDSYGKKDYFTWVVYFWWKRMNAFSFFLSMLYLPKMIKTCGMKQTIKFVLKFKYVNNDLELRKISKKNML